MAIPDVEILAVCLSKVCVIMYSLDGITVCDSRGYVFEWIESV